VALLKTTLKLGITTVVKRFRLVDPSPKPNGRYVKPQNLLKLFLCNTKTETTSGRIFTIKQKAQVCVCDHMSDLVLIFCKNETPSPVML